MKNLLFRFLALCLGILFPVVSFGFVPEPNHVYAIVNRANRNAFEIGGGGNLYDSPHYVNTWGYWGGANQQWLMDLRQTPYSGGYTFTNRNSRKLLALSYSGSNPNPIGAFISQYSSGEIDAASDPAVAFWYFTDLPASANTPSNAVASVTISNSMYAAAYVLENVPLSVKRQTRYSVSDETDSWPWLNYREVISSPSGGTTVPDKQIYDIFDVSANPSAVYTASVFQIINNYTGKALTVEPGDVNDRGVKQMTAWGLGAEEWTFVPGSAPGYYRVINRRNGLNLEIGGGSVDNGASVNLWEYYDHPWQEWAFLDPDNSAILTPAQFTNGRTVRIYSRHAGKMLEIRNGSSYDGDPANIWLAANVPWQLWKVQFSAYNRPIRSTTSPSTPGAVSESAKINLYPNPATDKLSLIGLGGFDLATSTIRLTDSRGAEVKASYRDGQLDVSSLSAGLYLLSVSDGVHIIREKFTKL